MNGNKLNGNNVNISNSIGTQFSPEGQILKSFDKRATESLGKQMAQSILKGIEQGLKNTKVIENALGDLTKTLNKDLAKAQKVDKEAFDPKLIKEYNDQLKTSKDLKSRLHTIETLLQAEMDKEVPNEKEVIRLKKEQIKTEETAKELIATQQDKLRLITIEKERQLELSKDEAEQDKQKLAALDKEYEMLSNRIAETSANIKKAMDESIKGIDNANKKLGSFVDGISDKFNNIVDGIKTVTNAVENYLDFQNVDVAIDAWSQSIDKYTQLSIETGQAFSTGYANTSGFQSFKNDMINAFTDNGLRGIYDKDQLMNGLTELSKMGFQNSDIARDMANDLQFAREYLGISSGSLKDMYELQVRSGDDQFVKKSLNAVISLQKAGNVISQEHLNEMIESNKTTIEKLMDLGMSSEAAAKANQELLAIQNAYDTTYGEGTGQAYVNSLLSALNPDNIGANFQNANLAAQQVQNGSMIDLMNNFNNSPSTMAALKLRSEGDAFTNLMIGSDNNFGDNVNSNLAYRLSGKNETLLNSINENLQLIQSGQDNDLEEAKHNVQQAISDDMKTMNAHMEDLLKKPWDDIANSLHESNFAKTAVSRFQTFTNIIQSSIAILVMALKENTASNAAASAKDTVGDVVEAVSGKGGGLKGVWNTLRGTSGTKAGNLVSKINGSTLVKGASIFAGIQAASSMVSDGMTGLVDSSTGQMVESNGLDRAAAVFGGSELKEEGQNVGSSGLNGLGKGAALGAAIGTIIPGVGTVVGGLVGGAIGGLAGIMSGIRKDNKAAEVARKKREEEQLAMAKATAANTQAIKNQRDMSLMSRFSDDRYGTNPAGSPEMTAAIPPTPISPSLDTSKHKIQEGVGGEWNGIDIDGFRMSSPFDPERAPIYIKKDNKWTSKGHFGIDFGADMNKPLGAAYAGTVEKVVTGNSPTGDIANYVIIKHPDKGISTRYYHLAKAADGLEVGQSVKAGQLIGYVGHSGQSTAPHLHYDLNSKADPTNYVTSNIFYPSETGVSGPNDGESKQSSVYSRDAAPVSFSYIPSSSNGMGAPEKVIPSTPSTFSSPSIEEKLDILNNTLLTMREEQNNQRQLLDALSNSPIYDLGV